ncbi:alpha-ketoglutarate-dependent dioxygenase AlkB family protein [Flavobacterium tiangeerense]|uniref:alpha-ketoglutarate-dependent dioxygenase AlkB family protein n=1 Tax=Flavobacterium tiangeerense TaxID=459471 RepID=UPI0011A77B3D|nr:alpha-ketoglutarate-dependent dioxygenase AlkB [Flavobacterium tiangeerense]
MESLFENQEQLVQFQVPDADITYYPAFFNLATANEIFLSLVQDIPWQQDDIRVFGKVHPQPRLTALYGNEGKPYSYSNITMLPHPWNPLLQKLKKQVEAAADTIFTTVLLNQYRDGKDSNGWHADNEKELGINPIIASLSFGAIRNFQMKHNHLKDQKLNLLLEHGSLLIMKGSTQHFWKHQIPKTAKPVEPRINLTFRVII